MIRLISISTTMACCTILFATHIDAADYVFRQKSSVELPSVESPELMSELKGYQVDVPGAILSAKLSSSTVSLFSSAGAVEQTLIADGVRQLSAIPALAGSLFEDGVSTSTSLAAFTGKTTIGQSSSFDGYLTSISSEGLVQSRLFEAPVSSKVHAAQLDDGSFLVGGHYQVEGGGLHHGVLARIGSDMSLIWSAQDINTGRGIQDIASAGASDAFVMARSTADSVNHIFYRVNGSGQVAWAREYAFAGSAIEKVIEHGSDMLAVGRLVSGSRRGLLYRFAGDDGDLLWGMMLPYNRLAVSVASNNDVLVVGTDTASAATWYAVVFSANGAIKHSYQINWPFNEYPQSVALDASGQIAIVGDSKVFVFNTGMEVAGDYGDFTITETSLSVSNRGAAEQPFPDIQLDDDFMWPGGVITPNQNISTNQSQALTCCEIEGAL